MTMRCAIANRTVRARAATRRPPRSWAPSHQIDWPTRTRNHPGTARKAQKATARGLTRWAGSRSCMSPTLPRTDHEPGATCQGPEPARDRVVVGSAVDAGAAAGGELEDFGFGGHGRVAWCGHGQGAVCGAVLDGGLKGLARQQSVDQSGGEGVALSLIHISEPTRR